MSREFKLCLGLRQIGWDVILLHREAPTFDSKYCANATHQYVDCWQALRCAARYAPITYHVFASWSFDTATAFVRHPPGKIVFDDYDVMAGIVKIDELPHYRRQFYLERICLERAHGLCCRSLETQVAKRKLGYRYKGRRILILDSCFAKPSSHSGSTETVGVRNRNSVYYAGNFDLEAGSPIDIVSLAKILKTNGFVFHLYPPKYVDIESTRLRILGINLPASDIVLHDNVQYPELLERLVSHFATVIPWDQFAYDSVYTPAKYRYCATNKVFDAIDAGCHVVTPPRTFFGWVARHYNVGSNMTEVAVLPELLNSLTHDDIVFDVARRTMSVAASAGRLAEFYRDI